MMKANYLDQIRHAPLRARKLQERRHNASDGAHGTGLALLAVNI
jgi:hypothetical protein